MSTPRHKPRVLIVGSRRWFGIARLLPFIRDAGCEITTIGPAGSLISRSRYVTHRITTPSSDDDTLIASLRDTLVGAGGSPYDWVLVSEDPILAALVRSCPGNEAWLRAAMPVDPTGELPAVITQKAAFTKMVESCGLPLPRSLLVEGAQHAVAQADEIGFPIFIKPVFGAGGGGAGRAMNHEELAALMARAKGPQVMQRYVEGNVGVVEAVWNRGVPIWWQTSLKTHTHPGPYGPSARREFFDHPDSLPILRELGKLTGFHGIGGFDFMIERGTGKMFIIEFHARPTTGLHMSRRAGWDIVPALRALVTNAAPPTAPAARPRVALPMFPQDIPRAIAQSDRRALVSWFTHPAFIRDVPLDDPRVCRELFLWAWPDLHRYFGDFARKRIPFIGRRTTPDPAGKPDQG